MKTIFKYIIQRSTEIWLPKGTTPIHVADQAGVLCLWAQIDTDLQELEFWEIRIFGTGKPIPDDIYYLQSGWLYIGTVHQSIYVWHVYMKKASSLEIL